SRSRSKVSAEPLAAPARCLKCGSQLSPALLACPACGRLVHSRELKRLVDEANAAQAADDPTTALARFRSALELLPQGTRQAAAIEAEVAKLGKLVDDPTAQAKRNPAPKWLA